VVYGGALAVLTALGLAGLTTNSGAHGLTEVFYAYTSSFVNNGQTFSGLCANQHRLANRDRLPE
jgi:potassium-transporting ATPase potassium-binding subunit